MIQNRHRIENEVLLGRQAVRSVPQNKDKGREAAKPQSGQLPQSITGTRLPQDGTDTGPVPTTSEAPMSMDTDAEDAFKKGSHWFFKRDPNRSGSLTPRDKGAEPRDSRHVNGVATQPPTWRRSWSSFFHAQGADQALTTPKQTVAEPAEQPDEAVTQNVMLPSSPSIFNRIRRKSALSSPFSTLRHTASRVSSRPGSERGADDTQGIWSSDTSSDDDLPSPEWRGSRLLRSPSLGKFEDIDDISFLSAPNDGHASQDVEAEGVGPGSC
jgi:hypothetical protein